MVKRILIIGAVVIIVVIIGIIATFKIIDRAAKAKELVTEKELTAAVEVVNPEIKTIEKRQSFLGSVISTVEAEVYSKTTGKVVSVPVNIGDKVWAGSTIAVIDFDQPGMKTRYYDVYSPIRGEIAGLMVDIGDMVSPEMPIATVVKPDSVKIETHVPADVLLSMKPGMEVGLETRGIGEGTLTGKVVSLPSALSPESHMATIEIKPVEKVGGMRSGMFTEVFIPVETHDEALVLPSQCLRREAAGDAVYVVEDGMVVRRAVEVGLLVEDEMEILSGVGSDDSVVIFASTRLREGIKAETVTEYSPDKKKTEEKSS
ncbi:MAG: efflux RND transporter periplasmic adaptor subunit [bacterium]|nr:efflux RND transporter periplasmic adaptor subunit [bacterium]